MSVVYFNVYDVGFFVVGLVLNATVMQILVMEQNNESVKPMMIKKIWSNNFAQTFEDYNNDENVQMPSARISF